MSLSDEERRVLAEMEKALLSEDPKFASTLRRTTPKVLGHKFFILGVLLGIAGFAVLLTSVMIKITPLGVVGFLVMLTGVVVAMKSRRVAIKNISENRVGVLSGNPSEGGSGVSRRSGGSGGGFMGRLEERWQRRTEGEQK